MHLADEIHDALQALLGAAPRSSHAVAGGCSPAGRARVELEDGRTVFAKWAVNEHTTRGLVAERQIYDALQGSFMPGFVGFVEAPTMLVLEDLGAFHWPPPWGEAQARRAVDTLRRVHREPAPAGLPSLESHREFLSGWQVVAEDPAAFLSLNLASRAWLEGALPALLDAERSVVLEGDDLLHFDARGDNLCFSDDRVVFVDWNWTCVGNGTLDVALLATSVHADGGPAPETLLDDDQGTAVLIAGFACSRAGLPPPPTTTGLRELQLHLARAALPWAVRTLGLPAP